MRVLPYCVMQPALSLGTIEVGRKKGRGCGDKRETHHQKPRTATDADRGKEREREREQEPSSRILSCRLLLNRHQECVAWHDG